MRRIPDVWTQLPPLDGAIGGGLDPDRQTYTRPRLTLQDGMQLGVRANPKLTLESHDVGNASPEVHTLDDSPRKGIVNPPILDNPNIGIPRHDSGMARKRPETTMDLDRFIDEIKSYKKRTGKIHKTIAEELGIELGYFHKVLYRDKPLTLQTVEKAAPVLGLTVQDFLIGAGSPGSSPKQVTPPAPSSDGTDTQRVVMTAIWAKLKGKTDEEVRRWYEEHEAYDSDKGEKK